MMDAMTELHARVTAAVRRCVEKAGVSEREAFDRQMRGLAAEWPPVFAAYCKWLAAQAPPPKGG
jgi:hypothetical protein